MKKVTLQNVVWKESEHYVAQCLSVDVSSFGSSKDEALQNLHEALELYFEDISPKSITPIDSIEVNSSVFEYA